MAEEDEAISCLRLRRVVGCLFVFSHSFLAAATFVEEEEGPLTIAMSRVDGVAAMEVVSIPRPIDVASLSLPASQETD